MKTETGESRPFGFEGKCAGIAGEESDLRGIILSCRAWKELESAIEQGIIPQSVVLLSPVLFHRPFLQHYARSLFNENTNKESEPEKAGAVKIIRTSFSSACPGLPQELTNAVGFFPSFHQDLFVRLAGWL